LLARLLIALGLTAIVDVLGGLLAWRFESGLKAAIFTGSVTRFSSRPFKC